MKMLPLLPVLAVAILATACGKEKAPATSTAAAVTTAAAETLDGNWKSTCISQGVMNYYRTDMIINQSAGTVTLSYPAFSDPSCTHYKGQAASSRTNALQVGGALNDGTELRIRDQNGTIAYYVFKLSTGRLDLQRVTWGHLGALNNGAAVVYRR